MAAGEKLSNVFHSILNLELKREKEKLVLFLLCHGLMVEEVYESVSGVQLDEILELSKKMTFEQQKRAEEHREVARGESEKRRAKDIEAGEVHDDLYYDHFVYGFLLGQCETFLDAILYLMNQKNMTWEEAISHCDRLF